jgi:hypothetical protein
MRQTLPRLAWITTTLLAACTVGANDGQTSSIECRTGDDGSTICTQQSDDPNMGDGTQPGDPSNGGGDVVCAGTGCVADCQYGDNSFHCDINCENGLSCESSCKDGACNVICNCPDGGGGMGCGDNPTDACCQENPDDPACQPPPPCPDGSTDCCKQGDPSCPPQPCPDGSTDMQCYCQQNPGDPNCQPTDTCPDGSTDCYCKDHPDDPACQAGTAP